MRLLLSLVLLLVSAAGAEEWSRFRGPNGSGVSKDTGFPAEFGPGKNLLWRTPVRPGKSSPVLTANRIFLTAFEDGQLFTICLDRATGKLLWERSERRPHEEVKNLLNHPAAPTPVTDGENVYALFWELGLVSYDGAGALRWKVPLGPFSNMQGHSSSPILTANAVVVVADQQDDSYIAAFDRRNGEIRWKKAREEQDGWGTPVLWPGHIVTSSRGVLGLHRAADGTRAGTLDGLSPAIVSSPVLHGDTLYTFGYGNDQATPFETLLKRSDKDGDGRISRAEAGTNAFQIGIARFNGNRDGFLDKEEWDEKQRSLLVASTLQAIRLGREGPRQLWRFERNFVGVVPSPLVYDGVLYVLRNGGILSAFDPQAGKELKTARMPGALGGYVASPVAADGKIYLAGEEGKVVVVRPGPDWEVLAVNDLGEGCFATPALSGGRIYLRTTQALYCFATASN